MGFLLNEKESPLSRQMKTDYLKLLSVNSCWCVDSKLEFLKCQLFNPEFYTFYQAVCHRINYNFHDSVNRTLSWGLNVTDGTVRTGSPDLPQSPRPDRGLEAWSSRPVLSVRAPAQSAGPRAAPGRPRRGLRPGRLETTGRG